MPKLTIHDSKTDLQKMSFKSLGGIFNGEFLRAFIFLSISRKIFQDMSLFAHKLSFDKKKKKSLKKDRAETIIKVCREMSLGAMNLAMKMSALCFKGTVEEDACKKFLARATSEGMDCLTEAINEVSPLVLDEFLEEMKRLGILK